MPRSAGRLAALGEEILDDPVFQRMEGYDGQPPARLQDAFRRGERLMQLVELFIDEDPERLETSASPDESRAVLNAPPWRRSRPALAAAIGASLRAATMAPATARE